KDLDKSLKVQGLINRYDLFIEDKIANFNVYDGAESIGSTSALYILKQTKSTTPLNEYFGSEIYTFENTLDGKFPYVDHFVFRLYEVPMQVFSKKALLKAVGGLCSAHKLNVLDTKVTRFKGGGFTLTYVLSQSNLNVHTWP